MSAVDSPAVDATAAGDIAARLHEAGLVRLVAAATGDGVAAAGLLAGALEEQGIPHQTSAVPLPAGTARETDADLTVGLGRPAADADLTLGTGTEPASLAATTVARELGSAGDTAVLGLTGVLAAGREPDQRVLSGVELERRPGVAVPVTDTAEGLAHSTLVHAPFSGSVSDTRDRLDGLTNGRAVASAVSLAVAGDPAGIPRGAAAVERLLRPRVGGPVETVGGYADTLDALARERPGHAVAVTLGADLDVLPVWRDHAKRAHAAVREARTGRYDGLFVAHCDEPAPAGTVARLVRDYRSPEPVVVVVAGTEAAVLATPDAGVDVGAVVETAARSVGGDSGGTTLRGRARFDDGSEFALAVREAV